MRAVDASIRFDAKVRKSDGCWEWAGALSKKGYGRFNRASSHRSFTVAAHRYAWERQNGPIPAGMFIMHRCDNRRCVRVDHLSLGTPAENSSDMVRKGRSASGERHSQAILTEPLVRAIRFMRRAGLSYAVIATAAGVKRATVGSAVHQWKYVGESKP